MSSVIDKINKAHADNTALKLKPKEVKDLVVLVREAREQATASATMLHIYVQRHYGQTSFMVH